MSFNQPPQIARPAPAAPAPVAAVAAIPAPAATIALPTGPSGSAPAKPGIPRALGLGLAFVLLLGGAVGAYRFLLRSDRPATPASATAGALPTPQALDVARDTKQTAEEFRTTANQMDKQRADEALQYGISAEARKELTDLKQDLAAYKTQTDKRLQQLSRAIDRAHTGQVHAAQIPAHVSPLPVQPVPVVRESARAELHEPAPPPPPPAIDTEKLIGSLRTEIRSAVREEISKIPAPVVTVLPAPAPQDTSGLQEIDIGPARPAALPPSPAGAAPQPTAPRAAAPGAISPAPPFRAVPAPQPRPSAYNEASIFLADDYLDDLPGIVLAQYPAAQVPPTYLPPIQGAQPTPYPTFPAPPVTNAAPSNEGPGPSATAPMAPELTDILPAEPREKFMLAPGPNRHYIPRYSIAPARLLTGAIAPASNSTSEPLPVAGIISGPIETPGNITILLHGTCNFGGVARGNNATSRVFIAVLRISCVSPSGEIWEAPAEPKPTAGTTASIGFTTAHWNYKQTQSDNYLGIEAKKVSDEGPLILLRAFLEIGGDYAKAQAQAQVTTTSTPGAISGGTTAANVTGNQDRYIWGSALGNRTLPDISAFVTKLLNEALPYFYVPAGTELYIVLTEPIDISNVLYDYLPPGMAEPTLATAKEQHQ